MRVRTPNQQAAAGCRIIVLFLLVLLIIAALAVFFLHLTISFPPILQNILPIGGSIPNGIGIIKASDGETIGISDGSYTFDTNRADGNLKSQAAEKFKSKDYASARSFWEQAVQNDINDAEALIYLEDLRVLQTHKPYVTLVIGTMLTGDASSVSAGRDNLQGAYVAQREYNDGFKLNNGVLVRLLIASSGGQAGDAASVAQQIVNTTRQDKTIVGVMGWPFSGQAIKAVNILSQAHIPMVSPSASSDALSGISPYFFRVAPPNKTQAIAAAKYAEQQLQASHAVVFVDPNNSYSASLAKDFSDQFQQDGNQVLKTETYTVGKADTLPGKLQDALNATTTPDLIYFAGYAGDMAVLLTDWPTASTGVQVMGGDALYELGGYPPSARANFSRLHLTSFAYPDEWGYVNTVSRPTGFFTNYASEFDPNDMHENNPYGYRRPDSDVMLSYDAMLTLLQGCNNMLSPGKTSLTPEELKPGLTEITGDKAVQGVSGQIAFDGQGNPVKKAIVILAVDQGGHIHVEGNNGIKGCMVVGQC